MAAIPKTLPAALLALLALLASCATLPPAPPHARVEPRLEAVPPLQICWLETAGTEASAGFAAAGWSQSPRWEVTASALLIRHPQGDILVDTGWPWLAESELSETPTLQRLLLKNNAGRMQHRGRLADLVRAAGADPARLKAIVLSHAHPDHAGGVGDLPGIPVLVPAEEVAYVGQHLQGDGSQGIVPAQGRALQGRLQPLAFAARPYQTFDESADLFGDGSVVITKLFGHTPGSVATFVNLRSGQRLVHVGDTVTIAESIERRVPKSRLTSLITDVDAEATRAQVARLSQLHELDPGLVILPAHDRAVWQRLFGPLAPGSGPRCVGDGEPALTSTSSAPRSGQAASPPGS